MFFKCVEKHKETYMQKFVYWWNKLNWAVICCLLKKAIKKKAICGWHTLVILSLWVGDQPGLCCEFKDSLNYTRRFYLKTNKPKQQNSILFKFDFIPWDLLHSLVQGCVFFHFAVNLLLFYWEFYVYLR